MMLTYLIKFNMEVKCRKVTIIYGLKYSINILGHNFAQKG